jgi:hypothetical protein
MKLKTPFLLILFSLIAHVADIVILLVYRRNLPRPPDFIPPPGEIFDPGSLYQTRAWWDIFYNVVPWLSIVVIFFILGFLIREQYAPQLRDILTQFGMIFGIIFVVFFLPHLYAILYYGPTDFLDAYSAIVDATRQTSLNWYEIGLLNTTSEYYLINENFPSFPTYMLYFDIVSKILPKILFATFVTMFSQYFSSRFFISEDQALYPEIDDTNPEKE